MTWRNSLNYRPGDSYASVRARAMTRLYRLANVGGPTATARAHETLAALRNAKTFFDSRGNRTSSRSSSRGSTSRRSPTRRRSLWPWSRSR